MRLEFGLHFSAAVENLLPLAGEHLRHQLAQGGHLLEDAVEALIEQLGQLGPFALATVFQLVQGLGEQRQGALVQCLRIGGIGHQYAGPAEHFQWVERRGLFDQAGDVFGGGDQLRGALKVDLQGLAGIVIAKAQGAFDLAARQAVAQRFAHRAFEVAEAFRQAQMRFQVAMVDRAQLPAQGAVGTGLLGAGEGCHAVDHG